MSIQGYIDKTPTWCLHVKYNVSTTTVHSNISVHIVDLMVNARASKS